MQGNPQASNFYSLNQSSPVEFYFFHRYIKLCLKCENTNELPSLDKWVALAELVYMLVATEHRVII